MARALGLGLSGSSPPRWSSPSFPLSNRASASGVLAQTMAPARRELSLDLVHSLRRAVRDEHELPGPDLGLVLADARLGDAETAQRRAERVQLPDRRRVFE